MKKDVYFVVPVPQYQSYSSRVGQGHIHSFNDTYFDAVLQSV